VADRVQEMLSNIVLRFYYPKKKVIPSTNHNVDAALGWLQKAKENN